MGYVVCVVDSLPFLKLVLEGSVATLAAFDVLSVPAVAVFPELDIDLEVVPEVLLFLLAKRRQFLQFHHCSSKLPT